MLIGLQHHGTLAAGMTANTRAITTAAAAHESAFFQRSNAAKIAKVQYNNNIAKPTAVLTLSFHGSRGHTLVQHETTTLILHHTITASTKRARFAVMAASQSWAVFLVA